MPPALPQLSGETIGYKYAPILTGALIGSQSALATKNRVLQLTAPVLGALAGAYGGETIYNSVLRERARKELSKKKLN